MHALDETDLLLDLLREAGDEPVTLDELEIVGVRDPGAALLALELAGHAVHRVYEAPRNVECVRLGAPARPAALPAPAPAPVAAAPAPPVPARADRTLPALVLAAVLLLLVAALRRSR